MKWNGAGESKTVSGMESVARMNAGCEKIDSAIVFYESDRIAIETVRDIKANEELDLGFMKIYPKIFFVPLGEVGVRQLKLFMRPEGESGLSSIFLKTT